MNLSGVFCPVVTPFTHEDAIYTAKVLHNVSRLNQVALAGYIVGSMTADPKTVEVVGPESAVKRVTEALTEPVSVSGARDRVRESAILGLIDPSLRLKNVRAA